MKYVEKQKVIEAIQLDVAKFEEAAEWVRKHSKRKYKLVKMSANK
jgi:hypothetical protein